MFLRVIPNPSEHEEEACQDGGLRYEFTLEKKVSLTVQLHVTVLDPAKTLHHEMEEKA